LLGLIARRLTSTTWRPSARRLRVSRKRRPARDATQGMQEKDHRATSLRAHQEGITRMSDVIVTPQDLPHVFIDEDRPEGELQRTAAVFEGSGAGEGIRTLDPNLGKVVLYP